MDETTKNRTALKPCPFCGGERVVIAKNLTKYESSAPDYWSVRCGDGRCGLNNGLAWRRSKDEAIAEWNHRAPPETLRGDS